MRSDNQPRSIQVHPADNVAIVVNEGGLPAGMRFESGLVLREAIPEAHKVALTTIPEGAPTIRYGVTIGYARTEILAGSWVHEGLLGRLRLRLSTSPRSMRVPGHCLLH